MVYLLTYRYVFRQVRLPDKEFRYLRTVIVTAAVHWGFSSLREQLPLTFQHRAGVSPYTSTFVLAETCVFGKQLHGFFSCGPVTLFITKCVQLGSSFLLKFYSVALKEVIKLPRTFSLDLLDLARVFKKKTGLQSCICYNYSHSNKHCDGADLIPKLRSLYCRVP